MFEGDLHKTGLIGHQDTWLLVSILSQVCQYPFPGIRVPDLHAIV